MALAEKSYSYSDLDYEDYGYKKVNPKLPRTKNSIKADEKEKVTKTKSKQSTYIKLIVVAFVISTILLSKGVINNERNYKLLQLKNELSEIKKVNEQLKVEIESQVDLNAIERAAVEKLNMQYPDTKQITYLQLAKSDFTEVKKATIESKEQEGNSIINSIKQGVTQVIGYLY